MSAPGVTAQQYAPRDNGASYSSKPQHHHSQPNGQGAQKTRRTQTQQQQVHSGRLIYADPRSLPSYPTIGLRDDNASSAAADASAAALYNSNSNERNQQHALLLRAQSLNAATTRSTTTAAYKAATQTKSPPPIYDTSGPINPNSLKAASYAASAALYSPATSAPTAQHGADRVTSPPPNPAIMERPSTPKDSSAIGSTAGSSMTAATLAAGSAASRRRHQRQPSRDTTFSSTGVASPSKPSAWGNSAANQAYKYSQDAAAASKASMASERPSREIAALGPHPSLRAAKGAMHDSQDAAAASKASMASERPSREIAALGPHPSLRAAKGAMHAASIAGSPGRATPSRDRSVSNPTSYRHQKSLSSHFPDTGVASSTTNANALSAATFAVRPQSNRMPEGGAVPYTTLNRSKFTSHPVLASDEEDKRHEDGLHASAVAMAQKMYNPKTGAGMGEVHTDSLQEAAYKLAQERLEKLHLEHEKGRGFRDHYMDPRMATTSPEAADASRRFSIRGKLRRRRSSSDSEVVEDRRRSLEVRSMVGNMSTTDYEKRRQDRQSVLVAAQRNVQARLKSIDEQVYAETGRVHPSLRSSWDNKAQAAAQARAATRQRNGPGAGQIDLGGGKYIDSSEVDRIASERVQPILDEINEKAEAERERQAALKKEEDDRKTEAIMLKTRDREMKALYQKMKQDEKAAKKKEKAAAKEAKTTKETNGAVAADDDNSDTMTAPDLTEADAEETGAAASPSVASSPELTGEQQHSPRRSLKVLTFKTSSAPKTKTTTSDGSGGRLSKLFVRPPKLNMANVRKKGEPQPPHTSQGETVGPPGPADIPGASTVPVAEDAVGASGAIVAAGAAAGAAGDSSSHQAPANTNRSTVIKSPADRTTAPKSPHSPLSPQSENESSATSPSSKVKTWLKSRFNRPRSKSTTSVSAASTGTAGTSAAAALSPDPAHGDKPFVGGHALTTDNAGTKNGPTADSAAGGASVAAVGGAAALGAGTLSLAAATAQPETSRSAVEDGQTTSATETTEAAGAAETTEGGGLNTAGSAPDTSHFADELSALPTHETSAAQVNDSTQVNETSTAEVNEPSTEQVITTGPVSERASTPPLGGPVERTGPDNFTYPSVEHGSSTDIGGATVVADANTATSATTDTLPTTVADGDAESTPMESKPGRFVSDPLVMSAEPDAAEVTSDKEADEQDPSLSPPRTIRDPAQRKTPSPVRDSRFLENLEGFI